MQIHRLELHEGPRLRTIRLRSLQDAPLAFGSTHEAQIERPPEVWTEQIRIMPTFVAVVDGLDMGVARGAYDDDGDAKTVWLLSMWVAPEGRGQGLGVALADAVIDWARTTPAQRLVLDVADDNEPAIALYQRMGFVPTGVTGTLPAPRHSRRTGAEGKPQGACPAAGGRQA